MNDIIQGACLGALGSTVGLVILELTAPFVKQHIPKIAGKKVLKFNIIYKALVLLLSISFLVAPYLFFTQAKATPMAVNLLASCVALSISLYLFLWVSTSKIEINQEGMYWTRPLLRPVSIRWEEVQTLRYSKSNKTWHVAGKGTGKKVKVSCYMDGFQDALDRASACLSQRSAD